MSFTVELSQENRAGYIELDAGESFFLEDIDFQVTDTEGGHISVQGLTNKPAVLKVYYTNWKHGLFPENQFFNDSNTQNTYPGKKNSVEQGLFFKAEQEVVFEANVAKHEVIRVPICRYLRLVVEPQTEVGDTSKFKMLLHPLLV